MKKGIFGTGRDRFGTAKIANFTIFSRLGTAGQVGQHITLNIEIINPRIFKGKTCPTCPTCPKKGGIS
jgi:hypothetical protein